MEICVAMLFSSKYVLFSSVLNQLTEIDSEKDTLKIFDLLICNPLTHSNLVFTHFENNYVIQFMVLKLIQSDFKKI